MSFALTVLLQVMNCCPCAVIRPVDGGPREAHPCNGVGRARRRHDHATGPLDQPDDAVHVDVPSGRRQVRPRDVTASRLQRFRSQCVPRVGLTSSANRYRTLAVCEYTKDQDKEKRCQTVITNYYIL